MRKIFLSVENGPAVTELEGAYMKYITLLRLTLPVGLNVVGSMLGCNVGDDDLVGSNDVGSTVVGLPVVGLGVG